VPDLYKALKKGFKVSNDGVIVSLNNKRVKLTFDPMIHATDGCVSGALMKPILLNKINGFTSASISNERTYDIKHLHKLFGYCGQGTLNNMANMYEIKSFGNLETCQQFSIAKA
jgi:hypothetical protein